MGDNVSASNSSQTLNRVVVCFGHGETPQDTGTFRCCPLGVQFYSEEEIRPYKILALDVAYPDESGNELRAQCRGIAVQSVRVPAKGLYRVWILFTDAPKEFLERMKCVSKRLGTQCPHCMNY